jgi:hypothetical protein
MGATEEPSKAEVNKPCAMESREVATMAVEGLRLMKNGEYAVFKKATILS